MARDEPKQAEMNGWIAEIRDALEEPHQGRMIIAVDDEGPENGGDTIMAAEHRWRDALPWT